MSDKAQTPAAVEAVKVTDQGGGQKYRRPAQFNELLTKRSENLPKTNSTADDVLPKHNDYFNADREEFVSERSYERYKSIAQIFARDRRSSKYSQLKTTETGKKGHEQFRKNQEGYREIIDGADRYLADAEKHYIDKLKPGQKGGLEEKEQKAIEEVKEKETALLKSIMALPPGKRAEAAALAIRYQNTIPSKQTHVLAAMSNKGFQSLIKPVTELSSTRKASQSVFEESEDARSRFSSAIRHSHLLRTDYAASLKDASRVSPKSGDKTELQILTKAIGELFKKSEGINNKVAVPTKYSFEQTLRERFIN